MTTEEHLKRIEDIAANTLSRREQWNDVVESLAAIREQIAEMERKLDAYIRDALDALQAKSIAVNQIKQRDAQIAALTAERDRIASALASAKGLAEVRGHLRDEAVARITALESTLRQIAAATSEPGIAARVRGVLPAEVRDAE